MLELSGISMELLRKQRGLRGRPLASRHLDPARSFILSMLLYISRSFSLSLCLCLSLPPRTSKYVYILILTVPNPCKLHYITVRYGTVIIAKTRAYGTVP